MTLHIKGIYSLIGLFALSSGVFASETATTVSTSMPGKIYIGVFGGTGSSNSFNVAQYGTAFYTEAAGGPLAVNAFGSAGSSSTSFFGAQVGYQAPDVQLIPSATWALAPAIELEGYSTNQTSFDASLNNNTDRLPEHAFNVSYPMTRNVFLFNTVFTLDQPCLLLHPYIGLGIGGAIVRISGADATQVSPPEAGVNHYNSNTSDTDTAFAGQIKLGLSYDINSTVSLFAEYRWLYIAATQFTFGSTVYPAHPATSSWQVSLDPQRYNFGSVGVRVNL